MLKRLIHLSISTLSLFIWSSVLLAQSAGTGALTGTISDQSGASVPNVSVTLTSTDTNQARTATSTADGSYRFVLLPPGNYRIRFTVDGFKSAEVAGVTVNVTETQTLNRVLELGTQAEQVTVEAAAETLQAATSTLGTTVGTRAVSALPLASRNYTQIIGLSAGANVTVNNASALGRGTQDVSVNGALTASNTYQQDGVQINNSVVGTGVDSTAYPGIAVPNPDSVQEFKIQTSTYDAGYGGHPGANVNVITKSGTNSIHGSLFEFFRNTDLNAVDFFRNRGCGLNPVICAQSGGVAQKLNQNQFGGTVGFPIKKDKLFVFFSYQETRQINGLGANGYSTPTLPPIPAGDRSNTAAFRTALGAAMCPANHPGNSAFNTVAGGVQVACDGSNLNPVAINMLQAKVANGSYFVPGSGVGGFGTVAFTNPASYTEHQAMANFDYLVTPTQTLAGRFMTSQAPQNLSFTAAGSIAVPGTPVTGLTSNTNASLKHTSIITNTLVNEARVSMQRFLINYFSGDPFTNAQFGSVPISPTYQVGSIFTIVGQMALGGSVNDDIFNPINQYQVADNISWSHGKHTIRAGFEFEKDQWNDLISSLQRGSISFQSFPDFLIGRAGCAPAAVGCSVTNPGNTTGTSNGSISICKYCVLAGPTGVVHGWRTQTAHWFVQDDVKVNSKLTLNLGLRWEYDGAQSDKYGNQTNWWLSAMGPNSAIPTALDQSAAGRAGQVVPANFAQFYGNPPSGVITAPGNAPIRSGVPLNNFAPRFGFAWQATTKIVVRGGGGVFYDYFGGRNNTGVQGFPYSAAGDYSGTASQPYSLATPFPKLALGFPQRWANVANLTGSNLNQSFTTEIVKTPLTRQYNLTVQYEFFPTWVIEAGFVGGSGINQAIAAIANPAGLASPASPINGLTTNTVQNVAFRVPYLGFQPVGLLGPGFNGIYNYTSLQATLRKQFSHGLSLQAAYTWSKDLTDQTGGASSPPAYTNNPLNPANMYGPAAFNRPQRVVFNYSWDLPFGHPRGVIGKVAEGWTVSGVTVFQDGTPLTFTDARGGSIYGLTGYGRAQVCPGISYGAIPTSGGTEARLGGASLGPGFFNNSGVFCGTPSIGNGTDFGNSGAGIVLGPGQANWDISLVKNTRVGGIRENAMLQLRGEFFNAFNHPQFSNPGVAVSSPATFGVITSTSVNPRLIQFALKYQF